MTDFIFLGSQITVDGDSSHEFKRCLLLGRKAMTNLNNVLKKQRYHFVDKVMSPLFNMLSRLVITFLPGSKRFLISWLQSSSGVIMEPRKIKSATVSPSICHEVMGLDAMIFVF